MELDVKTERRRRIQAVETRHASVVKRKSQILSDDWAFLRIRPDNTHDLVNKDPDRIMLTR